MATPNEIAQGMADVIEAAIDAAGRTWESVALGTGIAPATLSRRKAGITPYTVAEVAAIANTLGIPFADLTARVDGVHHEAVSA